MDEQTGSHRESSGAGTLIRIGAAVVIADWLLFAIILDIYYFFWGTLLVATYALFATWVRANRPSATWPVSYQWTLKLLGYTAGILGVFELLDDLRYGFLDSLGSILGGLIFYAGVFIMFWGARQLGETTS
jgi:hypothetical protein